MVEGIKIGNGIIQELSKHKIKKAVSIISSVVLVVFGLNFILNVFETNVIIQTYYI